ncbi:hypothetical protein [Streptomyces sp. NPDC086519]|uniref:hypothetical protein n=1 Tax=Streptomyces sp. NPDC086519 TaxID=3154863 RepID=UPI00341AA240
MTDQTETARSLRAVFTVTVETKPGRDYYFDHNDLVWNAESWIESAFEDRDGIRDVAVVRHPSTGVEPVAGPPVPVDGPQAVPAPATDQTALRDRIAEAVRDATCNGDCGKTEEECAKERIQPFVWHHGRLAVVEGTPEQIADAVLAVWPAAVDRAAVLRDAADAGEDVANRIHAAGDDHRAGGAYDVVDALRRLAGEAQGRECRASISGNCLREAQSETACATEDGECVYGGQPAREARQEPTQDGERVKHSGPHTKFCVLCLSGEHERVDDDTSTGSGQPETNEEA